MLTANQRIDILLLNWKDQEGMYGVQTFHHVTINH